MINLNLINQLTKVLTIKLNRMKALIDKTGMLTIYSETKLESYALSQWSKEHSELECKKLTLVFDEEVYEKLNQSKKK